MILKFASNQIFESASFGTKPGAEPLGDPMMTHLTDPGNFEIKVN